LEQSHSNIFQNFELILIKEAIEVTG